jgi:hypothetical protein
MRPSRLAPLDEKQFPLTLAVGLRATFADFASEPMPETLATLLTRLDASNVNENRWFEPRNRSRGHRDTTQKRKNARNAAQVLKEPAHESP